MAKTRTFDARAQLPVPAGELFDWHARPGAFERLTPPWEQVELLERSGGLEVGARTVVRIPLGPMKQRWVGEHTALQPGRMFQDTQREGPFKRWVHTHRMIPVGPSQATLEDSVEYELPFGVLGALLGGGRVQRRLERMFAYRHAITALDLKRHRRFGERPRLHVAVSGASGLIGAALVPFLTGGGHRVTRLVRAVSPLSPGRSGGPTVSWDPQRGEVDAASLEGLDAVVHLASRSVSEGRWSDEVKRQIRETRVRGTRTLAEAIAKLKRPPEVFVMASGMSFYGDRGDEVLGERSAKGHGFLSDVVEEWEAAADPARRAGIRVVALRIGTVLSPRGGALQKLLPPFRAGAGGPIGSGTQWMSWISIEDMVGLVHFALQTAQLAGPVNAASPSPVKNRDWAKTLGHVIGRPALAPLPAPLVRAAFGEMGSELLLPSLRLEPAAALRAGFHFEFPELEGALRFLLGRPA